MHFIELQLGHFELNNYDLFRIIKFKNKIGKQFRSFADH